MAVDDSPRQSSLKDIIRRFPPAWFAVTMGTGALGGLFYVFPYGTGSQGMKIMTLIFFCLNFLLFALFTVVSLTRYAMFPSVWNVMIRHPVQSLYIGTFPMGATTIQNLAVTLINQEYNIGGKPFLYLLWSLWWLNVAMSVTCCWGMVHFMETGQTHSLEKMTPAWLLPVVTLIVVSSSGGVVAQALKEYSEIHALLTTAVSVALVTIGLSLALMILTIYLLRLIIHGLPVGGSIISVFLPLGATGQAGYSILLTGRFFKETLPLNHGKSYVLNAASSGDIINLICVCLSFVLWSLASMWMIFAILGIQNVFRQTKIPFKLPFWGLIFPNAVYANLTIYLAQTFDSTFFRIFGAGYAAATLALWIFVSYKTVIRMYTREIFEAPCLEEMEMLGYSTEDKTRP